MDPQVRQLKDFLQLYNVISEKCFTTCVDTLMTRNVEPNESYCLTNCVDKFAKANQRMMSTFVEVQGRINDNRMKDYEENLRIAEEQARQQQLEVPPAEAAAL